MPKHKDFSKYVKVTGDCNVAVRGSVDEPWPDERDRPEWVNSGWSPEMARKLADAIRQAADEAEKRDRLPKHWPPQAGDIWREQTSSRSLLILGTDARGRRYEAVDTETGEQVSTLLAAGLPHQSVYIYLVYREGVKP